MAIISLVGIILPRKRALVGFAHIVKQYIGYRKINDLKRFAYANCGYRRAAFNDPSFIHRHLIGLNRKYEFSLLMHGGAKGVDRICAAWAEHMNIPVRLFPAKWENLEAPGAVVIARPDGTRFNVLAGFMRNVEMLEVGKPDLLIRFPGGKGTAHCANEAFRRGIRVAECKLS